MQVQPTITATDQPRLDAAWQQFSAVFLDLAAQLLAPAYGAQDKTVLSEAVRRAG